MRKRICKILITGGAGFIGSAFVRNCAQADYKITIVDKLTYAADLKRIAEVKGEFSFYKADICDKAKVQNIFKKENPDAVVNFAAETHVDRSIVDATAFMKTNCIGTQVLLDISRKLGVKRFVHISTDEVYGEIRKGSFKEGSPLRPNSPYAASKAAADLLIGSYIRTFGFPAIIIRPSNNYGPWQYPEKFIPVIIYKALKEEKIPVYAEGLNMREWLYVSDSARAIMLVLEKGKIGEVYNIGSGYEEKNINVVKKILKILNKPPFLIKFVKDRLGHDFRYSLDSSKIRKLGWRPRVDFERGIRETLNWYRENAGWVDQKLLNYYG